MAFIYLKTELKRALKRLPYVLVGALPLFLLIVALASLAARALYGGDAAQRIRVGVSVAEGDDAAEQVISMLASLDSVSSVCDFVPMDLNQCLEDLKNGKIFAAIEAPEGFVQDIINGTNTPVTIWLPRGDGLEGRLFSALTDAGAQTLSASQAGIYGGNELYSQNGLQNRIAEMERDLNLSYIDFSLSRLSNFQRYLISGTGDVDAKQFYTISAFVLYLFFAAIPAGGYLLPHTKALCARLETAGIGGAWRELCRILGLTLLLLIVSVPVIAAGLWIKAVKISWVLLICLMLTCIAVSVEVILVYHIAGTFLGGVALHFLTVVAQHYVAGGFLPEVFLSPALRGVSQWLPSGVLMQTLKMAILKQPRVGIFMAVCGMILLGTLLDILIERVRS